MKDSKILVTGAGAPGGPGIIKSLQKIKNFHVYSADVNKYASGRFITEKFFQIPYPNDENFIDYLLRICVDNDIKTIVPLVTKELFKLSKYKEFFSERNINILVSDNKALEIANDKAALYEVLQNTNASIPEFKIANSIDELMVAINELGYPDKPVVVKPAIGNGSRGIRILNSNKDEFDLLFNEKPSSLYCSLDSFVNAIGSNKMPKLVVSEYLPGEEVTIDSLISDSKVHLTLIRQRDSMREGISVAGHFINSDSLIEQVSIIANSIPGLYGPIGFQFKKSINGTFSLLESNPRLQGTSVAAAGLNYNYPYQAVKLCTEGICDIPNKTSNVGFIRIYDEIFYEK